MSALRFNPVSKTSRLLRWTPRLAALLLIGCARPDYDEVRAACGLKPGEHRVFSLADAEGWPRHTDRHCAATLGEAVGLDWQSFGMDGPLPLTDDHTPDAVATVLGGLLLLASADFGPVASIHDAPPPLRNAVLRVQPLRGEDASLGELLFTMVQAAVRSTRQNPRPEEDSFHAAHWRLRHTVLIAHPWLAPNEVGFGAGLLIHEALHREKAHDLDCIVLDASLYGAEPPAPNGVLACDLDEDSVPGGEGWALWLLHERELARLPPGTTIPEADTREILSELGHAITNACGKVCNIDPHGPCAQVAAWRVEDGEFCDLTEGYFGGSR